MVARFPQQVFLLLVLVTGTTMGINIYGAELPKFTRSSYPKKNAEMPRKAIHRFHSVSVSELSKELRSTNFQRKSLETNGEAVGWNREIHEEDTRTKLRVKKWKFLKNNDLTEEFFGAYLPNRSMKRVEPQSISMTERFVRRHENESKETRKTSSADKFEAFSSLSISSSSSLSSTTPSASSSRDVAIFSTSTGSVPKVGGTRLSVAGDHTRAALPTLPPSLSVIGTIVIGTPISNRILESNERFSKVRRAAVRLVKNEETKSSGIYVSSLEPKFKVLAWTMSHSKRNNEYETRDYDERFIDGGAARLPTRSLPLVTDFGLSSKRYTRDAPENNYCEKFEIGDTGKREFYSPNYPKNYPPLANCVVVLEAEKGMLLKLDFREVFELETRTPDGECRFDYLEVRDGRYGFSPRIGTYCDKTFPPEIISQSRYLWLHFHSDDTIEYQGFKAVWSTVPRPNTGAIPAEQEPCIYHQDIPADFELKSDTIKDAKKLAESNRVALDCLWVMKAGPSMKMQVTFDSFKLEKPNDCSANFLDVFDNQTDEPSRLKKFCGSIAESLSTRSNTMYIRLYLEQKAINSSFAALITAVRDKDGNQACKEDEYDCDDATCIASSLKCNHRRNCRFLRDEDDTLCGTSLEKQDRSRIVIILVIFSLIMFGMCTAFIFNCVRKLRRDHRIIREHIRQSREDRLDEIGRRATPCPLSVSRTDLRDGASESPAGEEVDSSKELIPAATLSIREYTKELALELKYGTKEINDIHQSNNVSNATQERLQESSEEPDTCDSSCQTRESLFAPTAIPDAILSSPEFSTFDYRSIVSLPTSQSHRSNNRNHRHPSPSALNEESQRRHRTNSQISRQDPIPPSERNSRDGSAQICPRHNPIPAPPGWSLHDPDTSESGPGSIENSTHRRYRSAKPDQGPTRITPISNREHQCRYPLFARQNTVGSGERYGSFVYGSGRVSSSNTASSDTTTSNNITGSGSSHTATAKRTETSDPRYRAEAVIEVDRKSRPFSVESTKSAPDVIATH